MCRRKLKLESPWPPPPARFPGCGLNHPFRVSQSYDGRWQGRENPRTIVELRMCALSNRIREESEWWEKVKDETIVERWREEALEQAKYDELRVWGLTPRMVDYVLEELQGYAELRDPETGIEVGPGERIWRSDNLIPGSLQERLLAAVAPLENVPDSKKDWHPGSGGLVLDLVNPFLYPILYGRTMAEGPGYATAAIVKAPARRTGEESRNISPKFQWLPSDFFVDPDGNVTLTSPYVNNIHPTHHRELYSVIPDILRHAIPMFERVLSDMVRTLLPMRITTPLTLGWNGERTPNCIWKGILPLDPPGEEEHHERLEDLFGNPNFKPLDAKGTYEGDLGIMKDQLSLRDRKIQVIVKLENIVLTPEKPHYPGGKWRIEGMRNESIVSSFVYYYDSENVSESQLAFRRATTMPQMHDDDDSMCTKVLYNMSPNSSLVQDIGDVVTKTHRCVAFPNLYQCRVQPFQLEDPTRPGHRKILVFFLLDPTRRVPSTTDVAPQQREWVIDSMQGAGATSMFAKLPIEVLTMISGEIDGTMSRFDAEKYREEMMAERTSFVENNDKDYFGVVFEE